MRRLVAASTVLCLSSGLGMACQAPSVTHVSIPSPTIAQAPLRTRTPTAASGPLTDAQAIAKVKEALATRGVTLNTLRIKIAGEPRWASIRYSSSYAIDSRTFQPQTVLVALAVARVAARVQPPLSGGVRVGVVPGGDSNVGLRVTTIKASVLEAWATGSTSDQEFVSQWTVGTITKE